MNSMLGHFIEWGIRTWIRFFGKRVNNQEELWLYGPTGTPERIGAEFYQNFIRSLDLEYRVNEPNSGLMGDFKRLAGAFFDPEQVNPRIRDFYERTVNYHLDTWSQWSWIFRPFGWTLISLVSRRIEQLNLPISPLETSRGMTSDVIQL
ncbi:MAG: hypothetical protein L0Y56_13170, partial [Nitrospira sp.]|nr:hypothetical protein [Nitrospira sp.]